MWCPKCSFHKTRVYATQSGLNNYRYRACLECGHKFMTEETVMGDETNTAYAKYLEEIGETKVKRQRNLFDDT